MASSFLELGAPVTADRPLIAYAFLAETSIVQGDLFGGLVPLFRPLARGRAGQRFIAQDLIAEVKKLYGLDIHPWAIEDFSIRLERAGLLTKHHIGENVQEYLYANVEGPSAEVTEAEIRRIVEKFIAFAAPILARYHLPVDEKSLEEAFFAQLVSMDFMAILVKPDRTKTDEKAPTTLSVRKPKEQAEWEEEVSAQSKVNVLSAGFIVECYLNDRPLYDLLVRIASGALIAEVVLNVGNPGATVNLAGLRIVLDGPFLMSLLDVSSEETHQYASTLVKQLRDNGADIVTFRHCADEVRDNLKAVMNGVRVGGGYGATARRFSSKSFAAYVGAVAQDMAAALREHRVLILEPPNTPAAQQYFSSTDEEDFYKNLGSFYNPIAQQRDAASVAAVIRLRTNVHVRMSQFSQSKYLFVTENPWIAECARRFCENRKIYAPGEVPPVVPDRYLAGLAWVLFGGGETHNLTRYRLLANCTTALEGRRDVVEKMYRFLSELDEMKAKRFRALMTVERSGQYLMQLTLGDSLLIRSTDDAQVILEEMEAAVGEKYKREWEQRLQDQAESHNRTLAESARSQDELRTSVLESDARLVEEQERVRKAEQRSRETSERLDQERMVSDERSRRLIEKSVQIANRAVMRAHLLVASAVFVLTVVAAYLSSEYVGKAKFAIWLIGVALTGLLAAGAFGRMPDILLGAYFRRFRDGEFARRTTEFEVQDRVDAFAIDWKAGRVELRQVPEEGTGEVPVSLP